MLSLGLRRFEFYAMHVNTFLLPLFMALGLASSCEAPPAQKPRPSQPRYPVEPEHQRLFDIARFKTSTAREFGAHEVNKVAIVVEPETEGMDYSRVQLELESHLLSVKGYRIVNRNRIDAVLKQQAKSISDFTESSEQLGAILNVDALLYAKLGKDPASFSSTLVSVKTGEILFSAIGEFETRLQSAFQQDDDAKYWPLSPKVDWVKAKELLHLAYMQLPDASGDVIWKGYYMANGSRGEPIPATLNLLGKTAKGKQCMRVEDTTGKHLFELTDLVELVDGNPHFLNTIQSHTYVPRFGSAKNGFRVSEAPSAASSTVRRGEGHFMLDSTAGHLMSATGEFSLGGDRHEFFFSYE
ncbi:MAG: hypothetical protein ACI8X5_004245 [Planctomycetota bacterium]|jgi:hypothetical protein